MKETTEPKIRTAALARLKKFLGIECCNSALWNVGSSSATDEAGIDQTRKCAPHHIEYGTLFGKVKIDNSIFCALTCAFVEPISRKKTKGARPSKTECEKWMVRFYLSLGSTDDERDAEIKRLILCEEGMCAWCSGKTLSADFAAQHEELQDYVQTNSPDVDKVPATPSQRMTKDDILFERILDNMPGVSAEQLARIPRPLLYLLVSKYDDTEWMQFVEVVKHPVMELRGQMHTGTGVVYSSTQLTVYLTAFSFLVQVCFYLYFIRSIILLLPSFLPSLFISFVFFTL